jgi:steroid delta-isomerase-like uncharacterized protein
MRVGNDDALVTSPEDEAAYRAIIDAVSTGQFHVLDDLVAEGLLDHNPVPGQPPGRAGFVYWAETARQALPDLSGRVEDTVSSDGKVAARVMWRGTHVGSFLGVPGTGVSLEFMAFHIVEFVTGQATQWWGTADLLGALMQMGAGIKPPTT